MFSTNIGLVGAVLLSLSGSGIGVVINGPGEPEGLLAAPKPANVELKWIYQSSKTFHEEFTTETGQKLKVLGSEITQTQKEVVLVRWSPQVRDEKGNWTINARFLAIKLEVNAGANRFRFDSTRDAETFDLPFECLYDKALVGREFKVVVTPKLKILRIAWHDPFLGASRGPAWLSVLRNFRLQLQAESILLRVSEAAFGGLPGAAITKGGSWTQVDSLALGLLDFQRTSKYTYTGKEDKFHRIDLVTTLAFVGAKPRPPFQIKKAEIKSKGSAGTIFFDGTKGRLEKSEAYLDLQGDLTLEIGGSSMSVELSQTQKTTVKITDQSPLKKKAAE
jgi:hypothetical protein